MSWQATLCLLLSLIRPILAQRGVFEPFVELTEEIPHTQTVDLHPHTLEDPRVGTPGLGLGGACTHDAQCAVGLACTRNEQQGISRCLCSPARPIYIQHAGIGKCVRAKSLYESCVSHVECNHDNPNVQCVDFLCYCPLPFVLTEDRRCLAPPGYSQVAAVVTPIVMLSLSALLGMVYLYHRVYHESWVPAEPHVVSVASTVTIPQLATTSPQPKPRYIRGLSAASRPPISPQSQPEEHRSDSSEHTPGSPSPTGATPKSDAASSGTTASPRCASSGDALQQGRVTVAAYVAQRMSEEDRQSPAGDWTPVDQPSSPRATSAMATSSGQSVHSMQSLHSHKSAQSPPSVLSSHSAASCHRISTTPDRLSTASMCPASPTDLQASYTCVEGSLFAVPFWLAGCASDGVSVSIRDCRALMDGEASPRRSRTASSVDDSFMRELKERLRLKSMLRLRHRRCQLTEVKVSEDSERTDDPTRTAPLPDPKPVTQITHPAGSPVARTPAEELHEASEPAMPSPVFESRKAVTLSPERPRELSALSQTSRREDPLEPVAEGSADSDAFVSASETSSINSLCYPEDYEESVRHTVALGWDMPAAVVVAATTPESLRSNAHLTLQIPTSTEDSHTASCLADTPPVFLAAGGNESAPEVVDHSSPAQTLADEHSAISQATVAAELLVPHSSPASSEGPMARTACAGDAWTPQRLPVRPSWTSDSSDYATPSPIRSRRKGTERQMSRRSSAVQTEACSSISRATTARMEGSLCDMYDRDSQMMRVLMAGNAHYLRERSATFGRTSTLDETLYICQQIGRQQEPPLPPRPATAASEVFVTRSTTALGSSCEDHEPLRLRHLVGLQHPQAYLMASRRRPPAGTHSPSGDEGFSCSSPQLLPPIPRPRRLLAVNAEPKGRASDPGLVSESPPRPKPRTRLPLRVPVSLSSTSERHSDSSVLFAPDSADLDWSTSPSPPR